MASQHKVAALLQECDRWNRNRPVAVAGNWTRRSRVAAGPAILKSTPAGAPSLSLRFLQGQGGEFDFP